MIFQDIDNPCSNEIPTKKVTEKFLCCSTDLIYLNSFVLLLLSSDYSISISPHSDKINAKVTARYKSQELFAGNTCFNFDLISQAGLADVLPSLKSIAQKATDEAGLKIPTTGDHTTANISHQGKTKAGRKYAEIIK